MAAEEEVVILARLAGTRQFLVNAEELGAAVEELGIKSDMAGAAFNRTAKRGYLMNQALFTIRRLMYGVTLATVASGVMAVRWGWQFNNAMQQARVALGPVGADIGGVEERLTSLYNFTKYTPFQFKDITIAFRQMYFGMRTLGISADTVQLTLKSIVDSLSATGRTSPGALNRVAVALQHMAYQGVLTGQAVNQLNRDGIPATAILAKMFHLTGEQIHNIRQQNIPTLLFLKAMNAYIESQPGLMDAAHRQATMTLHGLFTTFKDNLAQLMGAVETGFFGRMQKGFERANTWFDKFNETIRGGNMTDIVRAIDPHAVLVWNLLVGALRDFWSIVKQVVSELFRSKVVWGAIIAVLIVLRGVLGTAAATGFLWVPLLQTLIPLFIVYKTVTTAAAIATAWYTLSQRAGVTLTKDLTFWEWMLTVARRKGITAVISEIFWTRALGVQMVLMAWRARIAAAATYVWTAALYAFYTSQMLVSEAFLAMRLAAAEFFTILYLAMGPVGWVLLGITLLVSGLAILYFRWQRFHDAVNATVSFLWHHPLAQMFIPVLGPILAIATNIRQIYHDILALYGLVRHPIKAAHGGGGSWWKKGLGFLSPIGFPGMAQGGRVLRGGLSMIGENGPEIMYTPRGATVAPLARAGSLTSFASGVAQPLIIQVLLPSKRVLAEAYAEVTLDDMARA